LPQEDFDPLDYIEHAFLDRHPRQKSNAATQAKPAEVTTTAQTAVPVTVGASSANGDLALPKLADYLSGRPLAPSPAHSSAPGPVETEDAQDAKGRRRFRKTEMRAPRPRRTTTDNHKPQIDPALQSVWEALPRNIDFLISFYDDSVTANYYGGEFKESRESLVRRLLDPELTLEETSRLLGVCPATVRRYTNRGWLSHHRTEGGQRRFRLSDLVRFVEVHGRFPED
jgi:excisionase family DNA binding protein